MGKIFACIYGLRSELVKTANIALINPNPPPPQVFWLGTLLNPPKSISALLETCPYLSYSALYFLPSSNFAPFEEVNVPVSNSAEFFRKSAPWRILEDLW